MKKWIKRIAVLIIVIVLSCVMLVYAAANEYGASESDWVNPTFCEHNETTENVQFDMYCIHTLKETCVACGTVVYSTQQYCVDNNKDTQCDACGSAIVKVNSMSMVLDGELLVNFNLKGLDLAAEEYVATIVKKGTEKNDDTGEIDVIRTWIKVEEKDFVQVGSTVRVPVPVAAKELSDDLTITIMDSRGNEVIAPYTDTARDYAMRGLAGSTGTLRTLFIDMLNYGAAAQTLFEHTMGDMANSQADAYQQYATATYEACVSEQDKGKQYGKWGSWLFRLESKIEMDVYWTDLTEEKIQDMYAVVEYVDHKGKGQTITIPGSEFIERADKKNQFGVCLDFIAPADCRSLVTVTAYNADGSIYSVAKDSLEGYVARVLIAGVSRVGETLYNMVETMIKFVDASAAQFK